MNKYLLAILGVAILALAAWGFYASQAPAPPEEETNNFIQDGVVIRNNPGLTPNVWFLSYEEPGSSGLLVELNLNSVIASDINLAQGQRVRVEGVLRNSIVTVRSITPIQEEVGTSIKLYFYNPARDQGPGGTQCSKNGLVAVERVIPKTMTPLTDAIKLLLRGEVSDKERISGIESEFPLPGLTLKNATITNGVATLTFDDPQSKTVGGSCRVSILWAQIEMTAKQFPTVESVRFVPEELFQP